MGALIMEKHAVIEELSITEAEARAEKASDRVVQGVKDLNAKSGGAPLVEPEKMRAGLASHFVQVLTNHFALKR
jgi:hypothetical protein